jgi:hypothetical protein
MNSSTWQLIPLAVLSAITSPTAMAAVLVILGRPRPVRLLTAYVIGSFVTSVLVGIAVVAGLAATDLLTPAHRAGNPILDISIGVLILISAAWLHSERSADLRRRAAERYAERRERRAARRGDEPSRSARVLSSGSPRLVAALGVMMHLPGLLYLAALAAIANANVSFAHGVALIVLFNIVMLAPLELPLLGAIVAPEATERTVGSANSFIKAHTREGLLGLSLLAGGYLIVSGIVELVT